MSHTITLGNVLAFVGVVGGVVFVLALIFAAIALMNPFRSGH